MPARAYRALAALCVAGALLLTACDTDHATEITYSSAVLHGQARCANDSVYDREAQFELRKVDGEFEPVGPAHAFHCENEAGGEKDLPPTLVEDLDWGTEYEYRLRVDNTTYDADGTENGTVYDSFVTETFPTVTVKPAQGLRDSIGINTRTAFSDAHGNLPKVRQALDYTGIKFCRDSLWPSWHTAQRDFLVSLAAAGIKCSLSPHFFGSLGTGCDTSAIGQFVSRLEQDAPLRAVLDRVDSINEPSNDESVQQCVRTYQQQLYQAVKSSPVLADKPVLAPSLFANTTTVGDIDAWTDLGNFHPYPNAFTPESEVGGAALQWNIDSICRTHTPDPCQATEYGYHTDLSQVGTCTSPTWANCHKGVSESVRSTYTLRAILELYRRGVSRVDLYTDVSGTCGSRTSGGADSADFGFYDCNWVPFPVAHAMHNFTSAFGDGSPTLTPLAYRLDQGPTDLQKLVFRRGDGKYVIALWRNVSVWNRDTKQPVSVAPETVKLTLPDAESVEAVYPVDSANSIPLELVGDQVTFNVAGDPALLIIDPE